MPRRSKIIVNKQIHPWPIQLDQYLHLTNTVKHLIINLFRQLIANSVNKNPCFLTQAEANGPPPPKKKWKYFFIECCNYLERQYTLLTFFFLRSVADFELRKSDYEEKNPCDSLLCNRSLNFASKSLIFTFQIGRCKVKNCDWNSVSLLQLNQNFVFAIYVPHYPLLQKPILCWRGSGRVFCSSWLNRPIGLPKVYRRDRPPAGRNRRADLFPPLPPMMQVLVATEKFKAYTISDSKQYSLQKVRFLCFKLNDGSPKKINIVVGPSFLYYKSIKA